MENEWWSINKLISANYTISFEELALINEWFEERLEKTDWKSVEDMKKWMTNLGAT